MSDKNYPDLELAHKMRGGHPPRRPDPLRHAVERQIRIEDAERAADEIAVGAFIGTIIRYTFLLFVWLPIMCVVTMLRMIVCIFKHINEIMIVALIAFAAGVFLIMLWLTYLTYWN